MHGLGNFKIGRLGLAPVLLHFHRHIPVQPFHIDAAHFKTEGKRLVVTRLFIAPLIGCPCRTGQERISRAVNKGFGTNGCQSRNGLDNAGRNGMAGKHRIHKHRLVEDFHAGLCAYFIIDKSQCLGVVPGLLRNTVIGFYAMLPQPFLHFRHIGGVTVRRMGIHKGIHASQHRQTAQSHAPLNKHRPGSVPGSHHRSGYPRGAAARHAHIYGIKHRDFPACILYRTVFPVASHS